MAMKSVPAYERSLFDALNEIYNNLSSLKNNRNKYINSKQVYAIYDDFLCLLHELSVTRKDEELKGITLAVPNGNDLLVDDIWQLLSLCFVTCGLIKFAPATYSSLSTVYKLLGHLKECQVYTIDDIKPIKQRLEEIRDIVASGENQLEENAVDLEDEEVIKSRKREESLLLRNKLRKCNEELAELENGFKQIPRDLEQTYKELLRIRKSLLNYLTSSSNDFHKLSPEEYSIEIGKLKEQLKKIESIRDEDGKFTSSVGSEDQLASTQMVLNGLLDDCNNFINDLSIQKNANNIVDLFESLSISSLSSPQAITIVQQLETLYTNLVDTRQKLDNLLITRRWTMRETDLYSFQKQLKEIDEKRIDLNYKIINVDIPCSHGANIKKLQILILYLLRRCYSLVYKLLESSEPVLESLQPIHNQLSTVRRCLLEIKRIDGLNSLRDIYPFQFKLASIDDLRVDGKFIINGQIPEGQGTLNALLAECFDIVHELKIELEEKEELVDANRLRVPGHPFSTDYTTDDDDIKSDDEVELKRNRYVGFNEADYDKTSDSSFSESEYESNDYY